jgi:hypothetical protein
VATVVAGRGVGEGEAMGLGSRTGGWGRRRRDGSRSGRCPAATTDDHLHPVSPNSGRQQAAAQCNRGRGLVESARGRQNPLESASPGRASALRCIFSSPAIDLRPSIASASQLTPVRKPHEPQQPQSDERDQTAVRGLPSSTRTAKPFGPPVSTLSPGPRQVSPFKQAGTIAPPSTWQL